MLQHIEFARILIDQVIPPDRNTRWSIARKSGHRNSRWSIAINPMLEILALLRQDDDIPIEVVFQSR